jgi:hypothetical protein
MLDILRLALWLTTSRRGLVVSAGTEEGDEAGRRWSGAFQPCMSGTVTCLRPVLALFLIAMGRG